MRDTIDELRKNYQMIHYFGLGFIQLKIDDMVRMHFYTKKLPSIMPYEEVHNHRYDFTSLIQKGALHYHYFAQAEGDEYIAKSASCDPDKAAPNDSKRCELQLISDGWYNEGSQYSLDKDTFHRVFASNDTITKLYRSPQRRDFAQVIKHKDDPDVCPFSKEVPEKELWEIVESML